MKGKHIYQAIANPRADGKIICISTKDSIPSNLKTQYGKNLSPNHSYYVRTVEPGKIELLNPWGYEGSLAKPPAPGMPSPGFLTLDASDLDQIVKGVSILDPL